MALKGNVRFELPGGFFPVNINNQEIRLGRLTRTFDVVNLGTGASVEIGAKITGAGAGLIKEGDGTLVFNGDATNTYNGTTTVNNGVLRLLKPDSTRAMSGPLVVGTNSTTVAAHSVQVQFLGEQFLIAQPVTVNRTGRLSLVDTTPGSIGPLTLQGGQVDHFGSLTINGDITTLASDVTAEIRTGNTGTSTLGLVSPFNSPTFGVTIVNVADGPAAVDLKITDKFFDANGIRKQGTGTLQIGVGSTRTFGPSSLDRGTLLLEGGALADLAVNDGILAGVNGHLTNLTVNAGTVGIPGKTLILTADTVNLKGGAAYVANGGINALGDPFTDQISVLNSVTLGNANASPILDFRPATSFPQETTFQIVTIVSSTGSVTGKFKTPQGALLDEGSGFTTGDGQTWTISYVGGTGNDVVVTRNTAPAFANRTLTPRIFEGQVATLSGTITEPNAGDRFFLDVNWGDGRKETFTFPAGSSGLRVNVTHRYEDDGKFNVQFVWRDQLGGRNSAALPIRVDNVAPVLSNLMVTSPIKAGQSALLTGAIFDPGVRDSFKLVVDWGDGHVQTIRLAPGTTTFALEHRYAKKGNFTIKLKLTDDDHGKDRETSNIEVLKASITK